MSNYLAVATVTATLKQVLQAAINADIDDPGAAPGAGLDASVTTVRPGGSNGDLPDTGVNVFLYQVTPNASWRNNDLPTRRRDGTLVQRPQVAIDLHYLLSFYGKEGDLVPQRLLGSSLRALHARPTLTRHAIGNLVQSLQQGDPHEFLRGSDLAEQIELVRLSPLALSLEELSKLWSVFFQTSYVLSVAYQASVVLIEAQETPQPALPVAARNIYVVPFAQPIIERVHAADGEGMPIVAGSAVIIRGQRLQGQVTHVRVAGQLLDPDTVGGLEVQFTLPDDADSTLQAGVLGVQVVHQMMMGDPETPHAGVESNVAAFVLQPRVAEVTPLSATELQVEVDPRVGRRQRVVLLLNEFETDAPARSYALRPEWPEDIEEATVLVFPIDQVAPGTYLARVQVDGAESPLEAEGGQYTAPKVTIP